MYNAHNQESKHPTVIRIRLIDLLKILAEPPARSTRPRAPLVEKDLEAIKLFLQTSGPARRSDLEFQFSCLSRSAILHRLDMLKERGEVVDLPGDVYGVARGMP